MCLLATRDKTWRCCSASQTKAGSPTVRRRYPCRGFARPPLVSSCVPCVPYPPHKLPKSPIQPACRFCASFAAPPMSVAHPIPPAHIPDVLGRKRPSKAAAPACCIQLGGDLRISLRRCQLMGSDRLQEGGHHCRIHWSSGHALTDVPLPILVALRAQVGRGTPLTCGVMLDTHVSATDPARDDALQQRRALAHGSPLPLTIPIVAQLLAVLHILLPRQVGIMMVVNADRPVGGTAQVRPGFAGCGGTSLTTVLPAPIDIRARHSSRVSPHGRGDTSPAA